ncbi:hypothetical protein BKA67DRAFT_693800 [Truncatella angustata]|uniref:AA1-like domain-containing protein n=1 Tax=Truncatella angustata TaxID=152316 RepID=A0A9P8ZSN4_9PEZI|nr:uncharacterized protein BKA67DRAFT_693800 [Truncatella angustata]KAH6648470.1 hypothetical protein BKA67DRAFT_693800 [Truncatella angustata]KAH8198721.1 hypothetical protein TruAng_007134 [Truncatella angustata]
MHFSTIVVGLLAEIVASASYNIPVEMAVADTCAMPSEYTITNFVTFGDKLNGTLNTTSFHFADSETGIDTSCTKNSTSATSSPNGGTARYYCDDATVEFIWQTTGIAGLTVIEKACPENGSSKYEVSGLSQFNLTCTTTYDGTLCSSSQTTTGEFTSLNPVTETS